MSVEKSDIVIYQSESGAASLEVHLDHETVWLTQKQMSVLFGKDVRTVNEHIRNIFKEEELDELSVIRKFRITAADGKSNVHKMYFAFSDTFNSLNSEHVYD